MSETSTASRQIMLLILTTGLFVVVWASDSGLQNVQPPAPSRSAISILMETAAVDAVDTGEHIEFPTVDAALTGAIDCDETVCCSCPLGYYDDIDCGMTEYCNLPAATVAATPVKAPIPVVVLDDPVRAPVPVVVELPVRAPVPILVAGPVRAPVPSEVGRRLVERQRIKPMLLTVSRRVNVDYRMTCHCCSESFGKASRRIAALQRQFIEQYGSVAEQIVKSINGIDWKARLSAEDEQPRY